MSGIEDFEEQPQEEQKTQEEDPAAAFLAREQDELKGLEDDGFEDTNVAQQGQGGDFDPFGGEAASGSPQQTGDFFGVTGQEEAGEAQTEDVGGGHLGLGDFGGETDPSGNAGFFDVDEAGQSTNGPTDSYSAITQVDRQRAEPEKIRIWREENAKTIEAKDEEEATRKDEWREIAKKELDDWYKHHDEQLTKTKENNRKGGEAEEAFVAERDQMQPGEEWEKICRLCEFNPKNSKNTKDISRMRSILLQLKQTPLVR